MASAVEALIASNGHEVAAREVELAHPIGQEQIDRYHFDGGTRREAHAALTLERKRFEARERSEDGLLTVAVGPKWVGRLEPYRAKEEFKTQAQLMAALELDGGVRRGAHASLTAAREAYEERQLAGELRTEAVAPRFVSKEPHRALVEFKTQAREIEEFWWDGGTRRGTHAALTSARVDYEARAAGGELVTVADGPL